MKAFFCFLFFLPSFLSLSAQVVSDSFTDGNFTANPEWIGNTASYIINAENVLQLNDSSTDPERAYLSTSFNNETLANKEWRFDVQLDFSASGANKVAIYLASSEANLLAYENTGSAQQGYFLEIGETGADDAVSLFYRAGQTTSLIARGADGQFGEPFEKRIRVRRDNLANWEIAVAAPGTEDFVATATGQENSLAETTSLGIICFFTASRSDLFFFDNIYFGAFIEDTTPPEILSAKLENDQQIRLIFSEIPKASDAENTDNYLLLPDNINPTAISQNNEALLLIFNEAFQSGLAYELQVSGISDAAGNTMEDFVFDFNYMETEIAAAGDIIITEFLADPTPSVGLPEAEFIELTNHSDKFIDLADFTISDNTDNEAALPSFVLSPDSRIILCPTSALAEYAEFGFAISPASWPALNNSGDSIVLKSKENIVLDSLGFDRSWYQNGDKDDGGYSLERINSMLACFDKANWWASEAPIGGTPGTENSVADSNFTGNPPEISLVMALSASKLLVTFDKQMDEASLLEANYTLNSVEITSVSVSQADKTQVELTLNNPLVNNTNYTLLIDAVEDCNGNESTNLSASFRYDELPPIVEELSALADTLLYLKFNESILAQNVSDQENYVVNSLDVVRSAQLLDSASVLLTLANPLLGNSQNTLTIKNIADRFSNTIDQQTLEFSFDSNSKLGFNELLITEVMPNPLPDQLLPNREYIEIYNPSDQRKLLLGVHFADARDTTALPFGFIEPGQYLIACPNAGVDELQAFGKVIGVSLWPSLNNAGDQLKLLNNEAELIFELNYTDDWYQESFKEEEGGWSLEMIDVNNPCGGSPNWTASRANNKGTPGLVNAVAEAMPDSFGPEIIQAFAPSANEISLIFNEPLNIELIKIDNFEITPVLEIIGLDILGTTQVKLLTQEDLIPRKPYEIKVSNTFDCAGNLIAAAESTASFSLVEEAVQQDIVLNEVLYNPANGGVDFIELFNASPKYINLSAWQLKGNTQEVVIFEDENVVMEPGQFLALTEDKQVLINQYASSAVSDNIIETDLPSFPNGAGIVIVQSQDSALVEAFAYDDDLHLSFLRSTDGVSLERISPASPIDRNESWRSAASDVGFATPGAPNSQRSGATIPSGKLTVNPSSFSPDRVGRSYTLINYELNNTGALATVKIFNARGQLIKTLANNQTLGSAGFFRWDGDNNQGQRAGVGYYLIYFEIFDNSGQIDVIKERVAIGTDF